MTSIGEYNGNPIITLNEGARFPFSFGLGKAKLILENINAIKEFIEAEERGEYDN